MTYKQRYLDLKQKTAESYNLWLQAQNQLAEDENGFLNKDLWDKLDINASNFQKSQNEFNKLCGIIQKGNFSQDDLFGDQQACA